MSGRSWHHVESFSAIVDRVKVLCDIIIQEGAFEKDTAGVIDSTAHAVIR